MKNETLIADQVDNFPDSVLACRDIRHAWASLVPFYQYQVEGSQQGAVFVYREIACTRGCGVIRKESYMILKNHLSKLSNSYYYPDHYMLKGVKRGDNVLELVRIEQIRRVLQETGLFD